MAVDEKLERDASIAATTMMYEAEELGEMDPNAKTIQLLSAKPLCMTYDKLSLCGLNCGLCGYRLQGSCNGAFCQEEADSKTGRLQNAGDRFF